MTTTINTRGRVGARAARYATFCLLAFVAVFCQSREARAQWTTSGNTTSTTNNVGVGTPNPGEKLTVSEGNVYAAGAQMWSSGNVRVSNTNASGGWRFAACDNVGDSNCPAGGVVIHQDTIATRMAFTPGGNVGVGTTVPLSQFHIHGSSPVLRMSGTATDQHLLMTFNDNNNATKGYVGYLGANGTGSRYTGIINSSGDYLGLGTLNATPVYFFLGGAPAHVMAANGNVGIGTTAPAAKLHVAGDIRVDGNINAKYQDVAEWVPTTQKLSAGTVVILDIAHDNHVAASSSAYDTRVAGVVSAQPGIALGEGGEGKALVATTGRVKVKVDASRAPIHIGDLIVTSDLSGVAMRSEPVSLGGVSIHRPGTIIGKALESLEKGTGEILVLLSLQ